MSTHYIKLAFEEQHNNDGLTIMGRGLGIDLLYSKFVQFYSCKENDKKLVFCINATGIENSINNLILSESAHPTELPKIINNEVNSQERSEMYAEGGCFYITSRILIVDLLDNKVDCSKVSGLLVYNAHRISETSIESFVIRVFRERNREGFIKAFSEEPEQLQNGFGKLERLMKMLFIRKLYLWPRFRREIDTQLDRNQPDVIELSLPLTPAMKAIQSAVLVAMNTCLSELRKSVPQLETSSTPLLTLENGLFQSFDRTLRNQLDADWHKISYKAKQLVTDLSTLRKLLDYLIRYDAFSFYYLLLKLQAASSEQASPSLWLLSEAANHIFRQAKERVYRIAPRTARRPVVDSDSATEKFSQSIYKSLKLDREIVPMLECPPKWKLLLEIVKEIKTEYRSQMQAQSTSNRKGNVGRVLLIVKDDLTSSQLRDILVNGEQFVMDTRFRWFVSQQAADIRKSVASKNRGAAIRVGRFQGGGNGGGAEQLYQADQEVMSAMGGGQGSSALDLLRDDRPEGPDLLSVAHKDLMALSLEHKLLVVQEKLLRLTPAATPHQELPDGTGGISVEGFLQAETGDGMGGEEEEEAEERRGETNKKRSAGAALSDSGSSLKKTRIAISSGPGDVITAEEDVLSQSSVDSADLRVSVLDPSLHLVVMTHAQAAQNFSLLSDVRPSCVILYDPEVTIIRAIEVHQAALTTPLKLYFLLYEGSADEHRYVGALAREKKAFEALIAAKEHLVVSLPDHPEDLQRELALDLSLSLDSRSAQRGSSVTNSKVRQIVVDVREFRSTLPSMLHYSRFAVVPRTIYVADYVLSPEICVERKGISDLFQSFASGRLYNQAEAMTKHYKYPCLLIEFSADKPFSLVAPQEVSAEIQQGAITSRIALLAMSFPNLKMLWARSAASTVEIFKIISSNHEAVDVHKAIAVGAVLGGEDVRGEEGGGEDHEAAVAAQEILLSLPGINVHNFREVMNSVENLCELSKMSEVQLTPLVGPVSAKKLNAFFIQRRLA